MHRGYPDMKYYPVLDGNMPLNHRSSLTITIYRTPIEKEIYSQWTRNEYIKSLLFGFSNQNL